MRKNDDGTPHFTERHLLLIDLLSDVTDPRTKEQKCLAAGFAHPKTVYKFLKDQDFKTVLMQRTREAAGVNLSAVYGRLYRIVESDKSARESIRAAELLLRASGEITAGGNQVVNVKQVNEPKQADEDSFWERVQKIHERNWRRAGETDLVRGEYGLPRPRRATDGDDDDGQED